MSKAFGLSFFFSFFYVCTWSDSVTVRVVTGFDLYALPVLITAFTIFVYCSLRGTSGQHIENNKKLILYIQKLLGLRQPKSMAV